MGARRRGFTTIELLITVVVIGLLVVVALPSFRAQMQKSRRSDAMAALATLQQGQERWRSTNTQYAPNSELTLTGGLRQSNTSPSGYYTIAINSRSATGYVATATGVSGKSQADDTDCSSMSVRMESGNLSYGSGSGPDWTDAKRCWAR